MSQGPGLIPRPVAAVVAIVVISVWATSQLASIFVEGYEAPEAIHAALMIVLGSLFALQRGGGKDDEPATSGTSEGAVPPAPGSAAEPGAVRRGETGKLPLAELMKRLEQEQGPRDQ